MNKIFETFILNALFAFVASLVIVLQELSIAAGGSIFGLIGLGLISALGGSLFGEALNRIIGNQNISCKKIGIGMAIGLAITLLIAFI